ncbi:MAG: hypothetical protein JWM68_3384, partial [Verrucomicrobiales bacterium]|nr:hypothetical protein [Verrucomicrobiales bacterium]
GVDVASEMDHFQEMGTMLLRNFAPK